MFASNAALVEAAYKGIADKLMLPGRNQRTAKVIELVASRLADDSNGRWIMIVDDFDDVETLHADVGRPEEKVSMASVVPQSGNGAVLITSGNIDVAQEMVGREKDILRVGQMDKREAAELLQKAITQAAAYINQQPRISVSAYVRRLHALESKTILLKKDFRDVRLASSSTALKQASALQRKAFTLNVVVGVLIGLGNG